MPERRVPVKRKSCEDSAARVTQPPPGVLLLVILVVGTAIRAPGVFWGDGNIVRGRFLTLHPDERSHVDIAEAFGSHQPYRGVQTIKGFGAQMAGIASVVARIHSAPTWVDLHRVGRWLSPAYGLAALPLLFLIVREVTGDSDRAWLATYPMLSCSLAVTNSPIATADAAARPQRRGCCSPT